MSAKVTHTLESALEDVMSKTFELVDQRNSGFMQKGTENSPNPICLRSSKLNILTMTSEICLGKGKGYAKIQYIPNAPVIHVDDMLKDEKGMLHSKSERIPEGAKWTEQKGLKSLGYDLDRELRLAKEMMIGFQFGLLSLDKYGDDPTLRTYLLNHHCNMDRPNAEFDTKNHSGLFKFRCVNLDEKAAEELVNIDIEMKASEYIQSLRTKKGKENIYTDLNKAKIDATMRILGVTPTAQPEEYASKHSLLKRYADANPVEFMSFIEEATNSYKVEIGKAISFSALKIDKKEKKAFLLTKNADKKMDERLIKTFSSTDGDEQIEELTMHFVTDAGIVDFKNMQMAIAAASVN